MDIRIAFFVLSLISVVVLGPIVIGVTASLLKRRAISKRELQDLRNDIAQIKADIGDIKEHTADFIIKTN